MTSNGIVIGRHFRVNTTDVVPSSVSCLTVGRPGRGVVGFWVTRLLSSTPSEFHVYLSLKLDLAVYAGTKTARWSVKQGMIQFKEPVAPARTTTLH